MPVSEQVSTGDAWSEWAHLAKPLFRWAGGKQRFLWRFNDLLPTAFGRYFEPFAGGLSIYFYLASRSQEPVLAQIGDQNLRLIRTYIEVKDHWETVEDELRQLEAGYNAARDRAAFYYNVREQHNLISPRSDAARFIFLMCTCWNGVYRVNRDGGFNVPHGAPKGPFTKLPSADELRAVSTVFQSAQLRACSWETSVAEAAEGDFVFLDPPYYSNQRPDLYEVGRRFGLSHQEALARALVSMQDRGVEFLLTNSDTPEMLDLYRSYRLDVTQIMAKRSISTKVNERVEGGELIVRPNFAVRHLTSIEADLDLSVRARRRASRRAQHLSIMEEASDE